MPMENCRGGRRGGGGGGCGGDESDAMGVAPAVLWRRTARASQGSRIRCIRWNRVRAQQTADTGHYECQTTQRTRIADNSRGRRGGGGQGLEWTSTHIGAQITGPFLGLVGTHFRPSKGMVLHTGHLLYVPTVQPHVPLEDGVRGPCAIFQWRMAHGPQPPTYQINSHHVPHTQSAPYESPPPTNP